MDFVASFFGNTLFWPHLILVLLFLITSNVQYSYGNVKISSPNSIYPCLDTFDIMIKQNQDFPHTNYSQLIRAYTSDKRRNHFFKEYRYISEFRVPQSNLLHIECSYFAPINQYYCFSFVAFNRSTGAIHTWTEPECIPTLEENTENFQSSPDTILSSPPPYVTDSGISIDEDLKSLQNLPYGSSYRLSSFSSSSSSSPSDSILAPFNSALHDAATLSSSDYEDLNELEHGNDYARKIIRCSCEDSSDEENYAIIDSFEDVGKIFVEIFSCSNSNKCSNSSSNTLAHRYSSSSRNHPSTSTPTLMCTINFTIPSPLIIRVQIVKKIACGIGSQNFGPTIIEPHSSHHGTSGKYSHENVPPLIIRNGPLSISPQVPVDMSPHEYQLQSSILTIEATMHHYHVILISSTVGQIDSSPISVPYHQKFLLSYENGPLVFIFLTILFALLLFSLVISIVVNFVCKPKPGCKIVQTVSPDDGPYTATSTIDLCSLGQFSFVESGSMELDYYDYGIHEPSSVDDHHKLESSSNSIRNHVSCRSPGCQMKNKNKSEFIITDIILEENESELKEDSVHEVDDNNKIDMEQVAQEGTLIVESTGSENNRNSCG
ncbi:uncharacterized protein LOC141857702 [Brevipalpus obovatus]|uniref:uncharacterized protein LOC141857702 n=1 Tax=Brevipalpus obovatus TaxID=246614 RepID=UPI003D9DFC44